MRGLAAQLVDIEAVAASVLSRVGASGKPGAVHAGAGIRILYGGSVKPSNAREILALPNVGGALVGGASLNAADFNAIIRAAE